MTVDDLHRRFATLDRIEAPELWGPIQARAAAAPSEQGVAHAVISSPAAEAWAAPRGRTMPLLAGVLVGLLAAAAIAVGAGLIKLTATLPLPSSLPSATVGIGEPTPGPSTPPSAEPSPTFMGPSGLVAHDVSETIEPAPEGCGQIQSPRCFRRRIWIVDPDGGNARLLLPDAPSPQSFVGWMPDGNAFWYVGNEGALVRADLSGATLDTIPQDLLCATGGCPIGRFVLSPDGTRLAFALDDAHSGSVMATVDLGTRAVRVLESTRTTNPDTSPCTVPGSQGVDESPAWSPDGTQITFGRQAIGPLAADGFCRSRIYVVGADDTRFQQLSPSDLRALYPQWSPDGTAIAFHDSFITDAETTNGRTHVYRVAPDGSDLRRLTSDGLSLWPRWTADGGILFWQWTSTSQADHTLWRMAADGSAPTPVARTVAALTDVGCSVCAWPIHNDPMPEAFWQPIP
jgi:hypothetical protein